MNALVLIVVGILILNAYLGMRAGFIKTVFSIFSMVIALVFTLILSPYLSKSLQQNEKLVTYLSEKSAEVLKLDEIDEKINQTVEDSVINKLPLPESLKNTLQKNNNSDTYDVLGVKDFKGYVSHAVASIVINAISFVIMFVVLIILLRILSTVLNIISKLPILHQINKLAGLLSGGIHGLIIVWLLFILLTIFSGTKLGRECFTMMNESVFLSALYDNNLIMKFVMNLSGILG